MRDFNIPVDNVNYTLKRDFIFVPNSFGFKQFIDFPPHSKATLDLVCGLSIVPLYCVASELPISDHKLASFTVNVSLSKFSQQRSMSFRNLNQSSHLDR